MDPKKAKAYRDTSFSINECGPAISATRSSTCERGATTIECHHQSPECTDLQTEKAALRELQITPPKNSLETLTRSFARSVASLLLIRQRSPHVSDFVKNHTPDGLTFLPTLHAWRVLQLIAGPWEYLSIMLKFQRTLAGVVERYNAPKERRPPM